MKLLVDPATDKVVGAHMAGEAAGETIQGIAIALKAGATKATFDKTIGIHPIHLGVFLIINLMIGIITPPVGMVLFTVSEVAEIKVENLIRAVFPFYLPLVITLLLVTYFPQLVMFLPNLMQ